MMRKILDHLKNNNTMIEVHTSGNWFGGHIVAVTDDYIELLHDAGLDHHTRFIPTSKIECISTTKRANEVKKDEQ